MSDCRKKKKKQDEILDEKLGELDLEEEMRNKNRNVLVVSYGFNSISPGAQRDAKKFWPETQEAYPFEKDMSQSVCSLLNSGRSIELKRSAIPALKNHNPENLVFQHIVIKRNLLTHIKTTH